MPNFLDELAIDVDVQSDGPRQNYLIGSNDFDHESVEIAMNFGVFASTSTCP